MKLTVISDGPSVPAQSEDERTGLLKPVQTNRLVSSIHVYFSIRSSTSTNERLNAEKERRCIPLENWLQPFTGSFWQ